MTKAVAPVLPELKGVVLEQRFQHGVGSTRNCEFAVEDHYRCYGWVHVDSVVAFLRLNYWTTFGIAIGSTGSATNRNATGIMGGD